MAEHHHQKIWKPTRKKQQLLPTKQTEQANTTKNTHMKETRYRWKTRYRKEEKRKREEGKKEERRVEKRAGVCSARYFPCAHPRKMGERMYMIWRYACTERG